MSQYIISRSDRHVRVQTSGAGTCVVVSLYDPATTIGVLAHVAAGDDVPSFFATVYDELRSNGVPPPRLQARLVGGWKGWSDAQVDAIREALKSQGIKPVQEDILIDVGSDVRVNPARRAGDTVPVNALNQLQLNLRTGVLAPYLESIYHVPDSRLISGPSKVPDLELTEGTLRHLIRHSESLP